MQAPNPFVFRSEDRKADATPEVLRSARVNIIGGRLLPEGENLLNFIPAGRAFSGNDVAHIGNFALGYLDWAEALLVSKSAKFLEVALERRFEHRRVVGIFSVIGALSPILDETVILDLHDLRAAFIEQPEPW